MSKTHHHNFSNTCAGQRHPKAGPRALHNVHYLVAYTYHVLAHINETNLGLFQCGWRIL